MSFRGKCKWEAGRSLFFLVFFIYVFLVVWNSCYCFVWFLCRGGRVFLVLDGNSYVVGRFLSFSEWGGFEGGREIIWLGFM